MVALAAKDLVGRRKQAAVDTRQAEQSIRPGMMGSYQVAQLLVMVVMVQLERLVVTGQRATLARTVPLLQLAEEVVHAVKMAAMVVADKSKSHGPHGTGST